MELKTIITEVRDWLKNAYTSVAEGSEVRKWCMLGLEKNPTLDSINEHFDREELNNKFKEQYNNTDLPSKEAYAYTQTEVHMIAAAHRSFAARHKTRMQVYRDDCQVKNYHITSAITMGYVKHLVAKEKAEEKR